MSNATSRNLKPILTSEARWWLWLRISGLLMIMVLFPHVIIKDVLIGVYQIDLAYVAQVWDNIWWRAFDFTLLFLTFSHGMIGLRQVLLDFVHTSSGRRTMTRVLVTIWVVISLLGAIAILGGVKL